MATDRTQALHFSREVEADVEWLTARWVNSSGSLVERHFPQPALLKTWLVDEQRYADEEADALIAQLRGEAGTPR